MNYYNKEVIENIKNYYINPQKIEKAKKEIIENEIERLNIALSNESNNDETLEDLFEYLKNDSRLKEMIRQQLADEQGLAATRNYSEFYFNEIIQNANDNTYGDDILITLSKDKQSGTYKMSFEYSDYGFMTEHLIGFFHSEIHTKGKNLQATGKHGVGIKSLFYFTNKMIIESNVHIEIEIKTIIEDKEEKIVDIPISISKNKHNLNKTVLTIFFNKENNKNKQIIFNTYKLTEFIDIFIENSIDTEIKYNEIKNRFFNNKNEDLIFDCRSLLFTDKNLNKKNGIKKIKVINEFDSNQCFEFFIGDNKNNIVCDNIIENENEYKYNIGIEKIYLKYCNYKEELLSEYLIVKKELKNDKDQNFTVAFPKNIEYGESYAKYYETYLIPYADVNNHTSFNILINSKYSSPDRTKLTDGNDEKKQKIINEIDGNINYLYKFLFGKEPLLLMNNNNIDICQFISTLFHSMLLENSKKNNNNTLDFLNVCLRYNINNRYLLKYKNSNINEMKDEPYLIYCRENKENYEKKLIGQKINLDAINDFFINCILMKDTIQYNDNNFFDKYISDIYKKAIETNSKELYRVLNFAGNIKNLIYYRIKGYFSLDNELLLTDEDVDIWTDQLEEKKYSSIIGLTIIGRYNLHPQISKSGDILKGSFYTFLFSSSNYNLTSNNKNKCEKFRDKSNEEYKDFYCLKNKLQKGYLKDKDNNMEIEYYASWHWNARTDVYIPKYNDLNFDQIELTKDELDKVLDILINENELLNHVKYYNNLLIITNSDFPVWGNITNDKSVLELQTTVKKSCRMISFNFLKTLEAESFEKYKTYYTFYNDNKQKLPLSDCSISSIKEGIPYDINNLYELFHFAFENLNKPLFSVDLSIKLDGDIQNIKNLCPNDYYEFLYKLARKKILIWETSSINNRKMEILYIFNNEINIIYKNNDDEFHNNILNTKIATIINSEINLTDTIIILSNGKYDYRKTIQYVLKIINGDNDMLNKLEAFLTCKNSFQIQGNEYDKLTNRIINRNNESLYRHFDSLINTDNFDCNQLKKLLLARGIQDEKCACCDTLININNSDLIISNNENINSKILYPQLYEVVCKECKDKLRQTLAKAEFIIEKKQIHYHCKVNNAHQTKNILYSHSVTDGLIQICKK